MMQYNIKYFGLLCEISGLAEENIELEEGRTVTDFRSLLEERYPLLATKEYKFAVDHKIIQNENDLIQGSEVALLPPLAGG